MATFFTSLTTAAGFYSLCITNVIPIRTFGFFTGTGVMIALLVALGHRERSGRGHLVESTMVESALNIAAEQVVAQHCDSHIILRLGPVFASEGTNLVTQMLGDAPPIDAAPYRPDR